MKKILSTVLAFALVLCLSLSLASCAKMLSGKYTIPHLMQALNSWETRLPKPLPLSPPFLVAAVSW